MSDDRLKNAARQYYIAFASGDRSAEENARANVLRAAFMFGERERHPRTTMLDPPAETFVRVGAIANRKAKRK